MCQGSELSHHSTNHNKRCQPCLSCHCQHERFKLAQWSFPVLEGPAISVGAYCLPGTSSLPPGTDAEHVRIRARARALISESPWDSEREGSGSPPGRSRR